MLEAPVDRVLQKRRILGVVAAEHQPLGLDPVRRSQRTASHSAGSACTARRNSSATSAIARRLRTGASDRYSHSIVAGGFDVTSSTTRFTAGISLMIRDETSSIRSYGSRAQSAVIASSDVTARIAIG